MHSNGDILSFMDLLDLDEEMIDLRANNLMEKSTFTNQHLNNFIHLLQYKQLINIRENSECDNEVEFQFIGKLIQKINEDNIDVICKIITTVLSLSRSTIIFKCEHLIQQVLAEIYLPTPNVRSTDLELEKLKTTYLQLKICGSILNAVLENNVKLSLPFLDSSLEYLICCKDEKLLIYFLTDTVPQLFAAVVGYNILDRIWSLIQVLEVDNGRDALRVICSLSNYYLPVEVTENITVQSNIISHCKFWDLILHGLLSDDAFARKQSIYLMKRAIDYIMLSDKNINISSKSTFIWDYKNKLKLKKKWDNFFILLDSLDEKQSNIVLPSLKLLEYVKDIGRCWINCAFNIGLRHDNTQVRLTCLHYHLQCGIHSEFEAVTILEALNNIVVYDNVQEYKSLEEKLNNSVQNGSTLMKIMKAVPSIKWSPVPLYHLTNNLTNFKGPLTLEEQTVLIDLVGCLSKIPCNNVIIRKSIHVNLAHLIGNCCTDLDWKKYITIYSYLLTDISMGPKVKNPFDELIEKHIVILQKDINEVLEFISLSHTNIEFALLYFVKNNDTKLLKFLEDMIQRVQDVCRRQYSNKLERFKDAIFVANFYKKSLQMHGLSRQKCEINSKAPAALKTLLEYTLSLFTSDTKLDVHYITFLFENLDYIVTEISDVYEKEIILQMFKTAMLFLNNNETYIDKRILSIFVISNSLKSVGTKIKNINELLDLNTLIYTLIDIKFNDANKENTGRLRNIFYEKSCEIVYTLLNSDNLNANNILNFIDIVIESGGYGCLKWILKITNRILPTILAEKDVKFDVVMFLNRMWREIEEIKSNSQYMVCMKEFVTLVTHDALLKNSLYNNIVLLYCNNIIEYANIKNMPLYVLVNQLCTIKISEYSHMVYMLSEILLHPIMPRKENRIIERVLLEISQNPIYGVNEDCIFFNYHIQLLAVSILSTITEPEALNMLSSFMIKKIEELFKNKQRYHSNSQLQRTLQACLQNLLFIVLKSRAVKFDSTAMWCVEFLGRIPHQPYERVCLEWYISLYFYLKQSILNQEILDQLKSRNVPLSSQFIIMYWIVVHKIKVGACLPQEYEFVMELLLSHIMGPVFSIRLHAQYLSSKLYEIYEINHKLDTPKYEYIVKVINNTLQEVSKAEDKSFMKLLKDYFVRHFDIVDDLIPSSIYWDLPQLLDGSINDTIDGSFFENIIKKIEKDLEIGVKDKFYYEWKDRRRENGDLLRFRSTDQIANKIDDDLYETGTIQKKYIPWKSMSDVDVYNIEKKRTKSKLIVVASLIDKLPNLGGMARTSEVFGVETYVVDSVRHLQDKQFQGLSVSAERWVNVVEVRPGQPLKDYLTMKRTEGYSVVAAEQTSTSSKLQHFKFPKKTLLLLGHEKEGVPCDLLPLMDHCVEIPQQGVIRSLNVHVTAAIFIWEYARQNML